MFRTAKTIRDLQERVERYQNEVIELQQQKRDLNKDLSSAYDRNKSILEESRKFDKEVRVLMDENEQLREKLRDQNDADVVLLSLKAIKKAVTREGMKKAERKKLISSLDAYENAERYWREAVGNGSLPGTPLLDSITCGIGAALGSNLYGKH
jgi:predicted nuclease with TOPRIM domain